MITSQFSVLMEFTCEVSGSVLMFIMILQHILEAEVIILSTLPGIGVVISGRLRLTAGNRKMWPHEPSQYIENFFLEVSPVQEMSAIHPDPYIFYDHQNVQHICFV